MNYIDVIQKVLRYVDEHIEDELNSGILANIAGFSTYHFCRIFQWNTGYSVMGYVRMRRLAFAVFDLSSGRKIVDIAADYGFETHSGFSKAFKRHYGVSPEMYRVHAGLDKPPQPNLLRMNNYFIGGIVMEPKFVTLPAIKLAGYSLKTNTKDGVNLKEIPQFWTDYLTDGRVVRLQQSEFVKNRTEYGACFPENPEDGEFSYMIGVEVKEDAQIPEEFHTAELPPATYAAFSTPPANQAEFSKRIQGVWDYIMQEWFPSSGYEYAPGGVDFELYGEKCMGENDKVCEIYIPVVKK